MMAAIRILIWLPVKLVRRSSISNMAFPRRLFILIIPGGRRACAPPIRKGYRVAAANDKPRETRGTSAQKRWRRSCRPAKTGARKQLRELLESCATFLQAASCSGFPSERCSAVHTPDLFKILLLAVAVWA